jgi:hypothetical protein
MTSTANIMYTLICGAAIGAGRVSYWPRPEFVEHSTDAADGV